MIKQDRQTTSREGPLHEIMSELALLTHVLCKEVEKDTGMSYETVLENTLLSMRLYKLTDSGMTPEEAMDILNIRDKVKKVIIQNEDGTEQIIKGNLNE